MEVRWHVLSHVIPPALIDAALRRLNLELRNGITAEQVTEWATTTWWPHLRWCDEIMALERAVESIVRPQPGEQWADPQIVVRLPVPDAIIVGYRSPPPLHVDEPPPWAAPERRYRSIVGVALTRSHAIDGCLAAGPERELIKLDAGDVLVFEPTLPHCSTLNRGPLIRMAIYFRLLEARS